MTWKITDALLNQFDKGNADQKLVVAEVFNKGENEAKLSLAEFKQAIRYEENRIKSKTEAIIKQQQGGAKEIREK